MTSPSSESWLAWARRLLLGLALVFIPPGVWTYTGAGRLLDLYPDGAVPPDIEFLQNSTTYFGIGIAGYVLFVEAILVAGVLTRRPVSWKLELGVFILLSAALGMVPWLGINWAV